MERALTEDTSPRLPLFWEMSAPPNWAAIDFISDLHLSSDAPKTLAAFANHMHHTDADAVFILGDLFELWVGDDARGGEFEAQCVDILTHATSHRTVAFMPGNRDFLVGAQMLKACGVMALPDPTVLRAFGERLLLAHGDALCLADLPYQAFRQKVRSETWQQEFLAKPLSERRSLGKRMRRESEGHKRQQARSDWVDIDTACAVRWMHEAGTPTLIHGHTHQPATEVMAPGYSRWVLSDWDLDSAGKAPRAQVLRWHRSGLTRIAPAGAESSRDSLPEIIQARTLAD
jgi:UDP-2,3-diacylglucosamine hydrolase